MREVNIGGKNYKVVASPITLFFYKKEFKKDLVGDLMVFNNLETDISSFDGLSLMQMAWAMIKTSKAGQLIAFEQWLRGLEYIDFEDKEMSLNILEEARDAFFRGGEQTPKQSEE